MNFSHTDVTFAFVVDAVRAEPDLTRGVRSNLISAVERTAKLMGARGLHCIVDVPSIAKRLETVSAATLGFAAAGSLAAFQSNLRRALALAGVKVMPGKSRVKITADWAPLVEALKRHNQFLWPALSRLVHFACERGVTPDVMGPVFFGRFIQEMRDTCIGSKVDKTARNTLKAWNTARTGVQGWPSSELATEKKTNLPKLLPWSALPASLQADAEAFISPSVDCWLRC